jgi:hypothetical protein
MMLTGHVVDLRLLATIFYGFSAVALIGSHVPDAAMAVLVVVPVHGCTGAVRPVLTAPRDCVYTVRNNDSE